MTLWYFLLGITTLWLGIWLLWSYIALNGLEEPEFSIILEEKNYEIRYYKPYIVAEVEVYGNQRNALNDGFRILAWYIFGWNRTQESISMTTPVADIKDSETISMTTPVIDIKEKASQHKIQFTMPSSYTMESLPVPDDSRVKLLELTPKKVAALRFTGWVSEKRADKKIAELKNYVLRDWYVLVWEASLAQYNPPFSFPLMRRNEILLEIE